MTHTAFEDIHQSRVRFLQLFSLWFVSALLIPAFGRPVTLFNDSVQYIAGSDSFASGMGYATPVLYFDEHFRSGLMPAPQTVWPPGYPAMMSLLHWLGITSLEAGTAVSLVSFALLVSLVFLLTARLTGSMPAAGLAALWQFGLSEYWCYTGIVNSDMPYTAFSLVVFLFLAKPRSFVSLALASLTAGVCFSIRYVGIFLLATVAVLTLHMVWELFKQRRLMSSALSLLAASPGFLIAGAIMLRNLMLTGTLTGGNSKEASRALTDLFSVTAKSLIDVITGVTSQEFARGAVTSLLAAAALLLFCILLMTTSIALAANQRSIRRSPLASALVMYSLFYAFGITAIAATSMISFENRNFIPLVPLLVILIVSFTWQAAGRLREYQMWRRSKTALVFAICLFTVMQGLSYPRRVAAYQKFPQQVDFAAVKWLKSRSSAAEVVMHIGNGQRTAYYTKLKTVEVPERRFTEFDWDESRILEVCAHYQVKYLAARKNLDSRQYSDFAGNLAAGRPSSWLKLEAQTPLTYIYSVDFGSARLD